VPERSGRDAADAANPGASAYEGRTDNPHADTDAGRRGPAAGAGAQDGGRQAPSTEPAREGGGAADQRE
jgi:hypothetical protein